MKVLHLSEYGLPDWRIEKAAITAKSKGYKIYFVGAKKQTDYRNLIFDRIYEISWNIKAKYRFPFYYQLLKKKLKILLKKLDLT